MFTFFKPACYCARRSEYIQYTTSVSMSSVLFYSIVNNSKGKVLDSQKLLKVIKSYGCPVLMFYQQTYNCKLVKCAVKKEYYPGTWLLCKRMVGQMAQSFLKNRYWPYFYFSINKINQAWEACGTSIYSPLFLMCAYIICILDSFSSWILFLKLILALNI